MDCTEVTRFIPFVGTQLLYWTTFLPASEPCLLALVIKVIFLEYASPYLLKIERFVFFAELCLVELFKSLMFLELNLF